ncbi:hypothetical protein RHGRI_015731 [Rhododendron griersonianum]|uniref:Secreted protein n=1 Tax=Rhododendron griersonianum TaxID=479676 RepID=A0AAV6JN96_9ERIC|nr:hypothetical protein RHGRI_015731 [Rhododendron griersonianum]
MLFCLSLIAGILKIAAGLRGSVTHSHAHQRSHVSESLQMVEKGTMEDAGCSSVIIVNLETCVLPVVQMTGRE